MEDRAPHLDTLLDLQTRHDNLLQRLDELDREVEKVLRECQTARTEEVPSGEPTPGS